MATCWALAERGHDVTLVVRPDTAPLPRDPFAFYGWPANRRLRSRRCRCRADRGGGAFASSRRRAAVARPRRGRLHARPGPRRAAAADCPPVGGRARLRIARRGDDGERGDAAAAWQAGPRAVGAEAAPARSSGAARLGARRGVRDDHARACRRTRGTYGPRSNVFVVPDGARAIRGTRGQRRCPGRAARRRVRRASLSVEGRRRLRPRARARAARLAG